MAERQRIDVLKSNGNFVKLHNKSADFLDTGRCPCFVHMRISIWTKHGRLPLGYLRQYCDPVIQVRDHCLLFVIYVAKVPVVDAKATRTKKL